MMRIRCAICDRPVELIEWWEDCMNKAINIRVTCHGQKDTMVLSHDVLLDRSLADQIENGEGVAFATKRLSDNP